VYVCVCVCLCVVALLGCAHQAPAVSLCAVSLCLYAAAHTRRRASSRCPRKVCVCVCVSVCVCLWCVRVCYSIQYEIRVVSE